MTVEDKMARECVGPGRKNNLSVCSSSHLICCLTHIFAMESSVENIKLSLSNFIYHFNVPLVDISRWFLGNLCFQLFCFQVCGVRQTEVFVNKYKYFNFIPPNMMWIMYLSPISINLSSLTTKKELNSGVSYTLSIYKTAFHSLDWDICRHLILVIFTSSPTTRPGPADWTWEQMLLRSCHVVWPTIKLQGNLWSFKINLNLILVV